MYTSVGSGSVFLHAPCHRRPRATAQPARCTSLGPLLLIRSWALLPRTPTSRNHPACPAPHQRHPTRLLRPDLAVVAELFGHVRLDRTRHWSCSPKRTAHAPAPACSPHFSDHDRYSASTRVSRACSTADVLVLRCYLASLRAGTSTSAKSWRWPWLKHRARLRGLQRCQRSAYCRGVPGGSCGASRARR